MDLVEFERRAHEAFEAIPPEFREGVQGPVVIAEPKRHKSVRGMLTLGECLHAPTWHAEGPLLSTIFLYYGSFAAVASRDPGFDVEAELRDTIRHEVQHHIEDMAGASQLRDYDWAAEENQKRLAGEPYAPNYWRGGERVKGDEDLRMVDGDLFLEVELAKGEWDDARRQGLVLTVGGEELEIPAEEIQEDEEVFEFDGPFEVESALHHEPADGDLVVILRRHGAPPRRNGRR